MKKAIGFLKNLKFAANQDSDGDTFFCKEYDFFKTIDEMISELEKDEVQYVCGNCFQPQTENLPCNQKNALCINCGADEWIDNSDLRLDGGLKKWAKYQCLDRKVSPKLIEYLLNI
jgi:hypothetical protein